MKEVIKGREVTTVKNGKILLFKFLTFQYFRLMPVQYLRRNEVEWKEGKGGTFNS